MDTAKLTNFILESFLSPLFADDQITDISYNGKSIYYLHNFKGRKKANISIDEVSAKDFIRQIANLSEKQFSFQSPFLDVSVGRYRINAVHPCIGRLNNQPCLTFCIRIASNHLLITDSSSFLNAPLKSLFEVLLGSKMSIVVGGITGSGKTEFQKYLISKLDEMSRIIIIDNVLELDCLSIEKELDINIWQSDEKNTEMSIQALVRNALRSNPDWLLVAESRGKEMLEVLNSAMTGHPIITTIHAMNVTSMPTRIARMVMMSEQKQDFETLMQDIYYHFRFYVFLKRTINKNGLVHRYVEEVAFVTENGEKHTIYSGNKKEYKTFPIDRYTLSLLEYEENAVFKKFFVEEKT